MRKGKLLPLMAVKGMIQNGNVYFPYLLAGIFSVFTYFVLASILHNDIIAILPTSEYAWMLLMVGKVLLAIILLLFLYYANSFLIKRRKKEFGLYHILGLEKKHIGGMMLCESILLYLIAVAGGIILGVVLAKLLFLLLLRMSGLPVCVEFIFYPAAFRETLMFFLWVYGVNFADGLWKIGKTRPVELMSGSKKGEKEPKFLWFYALLGTLTLGIGYRISITTEIDAMIFTNFFLAVFLVIVGTYLLFTSGSIAFLKLVKKNRRIYYKPKNFITVSGMLYRMKKSAASLSNICIFSTMVIITLVCTVSLYLGIDDILRFGWPYDAVAHFRDSKVTEEAVDRKVKELEEKYGLSAKRVDIYDSLRLSTTKEENRFTVRTDAHNNRDDYKVEIITLGEYNRMEGRSVVLGKEEALIFCSGADFGYDGVNFFGNEFQISGELSKYFPKPKAAANTFEVEYVIVVKDKSIRDQCIRSWAEANSVEDMEAFLNSETQYVNLLLEGEDEEKDGFLKEFSLWCQSLPGFSKLQDGTAGRADIITMMGGLLFLGVIFGLIFFMCLILIMYYKQVQEGYEDKRGFAIMQQVGMSDKEIRATVHRQILLVFGLPLAGAVLHTAAGMFMVESLMATLRLFNTSLMIRCGIGVAALFVIVYGFSYLATAKTYYKIVK